MLFYAKSCSMLINLIEPTVFIEFLDIQPMQISFIKDLSGNLNSAHTLRLI